MKGPPVYPTTKTLLACLLAFAIVAPGCSRASSNKAGGQNPATQADAGKAGPTTATTGPAALASLGTEFPPKFINRGAKAPDFTFVDHRGKQLKLADMAGKVVVLEFVDWDSPAVKTLYSETNLIDAIGFFAASDEDGHVTWVTIDPTPLASKDRTLKSLESLEVAPEDYLDADRYHAVADPEGGIARLFGIKVVPQFVVINHLGEVIYRGAYDNSDKPDEEFVEYLEHALDDFLLGEEIEHRTSEPHGTPLKLKGQ